MGLPAFKGGLPLFRDGKPCFAAGPCACGGGCTTGNCTGVQYTISASLGWANSADIDLYGQMDGGTVCYFDSPKVNPFSSFRTFAGGLTLNGDAYPICGFTFAPPEVIELYPLGTIATAAHTFRFWWNRFSDCVAPTPPATMGVVVNNVGTAAICVNGTRVEPGDSWTTDTIGYTDTRNRVPTYAGGTVVEVTCAG